MKELKRILSYTRRAVDEYAMIEEGDKIAVGVSAGKDSLALLYALAEMRRFYELGIASRNMALKTQGNLVPDKSQELKDEIKTAEREWIMETRQEALKAVKQDLGIDNKEQSSIDEHTAPQTENR